MQEIVDDFDFEDQQEKNKLKTTLAMMHGNFILSLYKIRDILEIFRNTNLTIHNYYSLYIYFRVQ